jgi:hypothetical protein
VADFGGAADVLDLRPWESSDVYVDAISVGTDDPNLDTLVVSAADRGLVVYGHFAPLAFHRDENGTMEKIVSGDVAGTAHPLAGPGCPAFGRHGARVMRGALFTGVRRRMVLRGPHPVSCITWVPSGVVVPSTTRDA